MVLGSVTVLGATLLIVANPTVPFNPLPPPTLPAVLQIPSATLTSTPSATPIATNTPSATWTPTITLTALPSNTPTYTLTPSPTHTPSPTYTPTYTSTPVLAGLPSNTPAPAGVLPVSTEGIAAQPGIVIPTGQAAPLGAGEVQSVYPFIASTPELRSNTNSQGCDWLGIAGQVIGLQGESLLNYPVEVAGDQFLEVQFSGSAPTYGASGFEVNVDSHPRQATFSVRLLGPTGDPLSDYILVETGTDCQTNLIYLELQQVRGN